MSQLSDLPILPPVQFLSTDDYIPVWDKADNRSPKRATVAEILAVGGTPIGYADFARVVYFPNPLGEGRTVDDFTFPVVGSGGSVYTIDYAEGEEGGVMHIPGEHVHPVFRDNLPDDGDGWVSLPDVFILNPGKVVSLTYTGENLAHARFQVDGWPLLEVIDYPAVYFQSIVARNCPVLREVEFSAFLVGDDGIDLSGNPSLETVFIDEGYYDGTTGFEVNLEGSKTNLTSFTFTFPDKLTKLDLSGASQLTVLNLTNFSDNPFGALEFLSLAGCSSLAQGVTWPDGVIEGGNLKHLDLSETTFGLEFGSSLPSLELFRANERSSVGSSGLTLWGGSGPGLAVEIRDVPVITMNFIELYNVVSLDFTGSTVSDIYIESGTVPAAQLDHLVAQLDGGQGGSFYLGEGVINGGSLSAASLAKLADLENNQDWTITILSPQP
jgi:hypothetical protein